MNSNSSSIFSDGFNVGDIVWGRRNNDGIYWPGRITFISNNSAETISTNNDLASQAWSYFIQFFGYNQSNWTIDVLPYRQYRDYMSKNLVVHYDHYPQIKYQFLNAINQADYADINESSNSVKSNNYTSFYSSKNNYNYNYIPASSSITTAYPNSAPHAISEYPLNYNSHYASSCPYNTQLYSSNYCSCCTQSSFSSTNQLPIETNLNNEYHQLQNDAVSPQTETFQKTNSIIIITTKSYSNSSFISYLFNCLSKFFYHSIIYIDDLTNYQHPNTSSISYLICLDYFDSIIKQTLDSTILNNLNVHINYLFLVINSPSHELVRHLYCRVMDKRIILVLRYHSTFDNEPLLLCSGNRTIFEMTRSSLLKYLCSKIKYVESSEDKEEQLYATDDSTFVSQSNKIKNEPMVEIPNPTVESNPFINYQNSIKECLPSSSSVMKYRKKLGRRRIINNLGKKLLKRKSKHHLSKNGTKCASSSEYYVQNILNTFNTS